MAFMKRRRFIPVRGRKSAVPDGLWMKCVGCKQAVFRTEVEENLHVCPACGKHYRIGAMTRIEITVDPGSFQETHTEVQTADPLGFAVEGVSYTEKVKTAMTKTALPCAMVTGFANIERHPLVLGVMDFRFRGGSMGSAVGEKFCRLIDDAIAGPLPLVVFSASGGARMEEGIVSLMQMSKTAEAVRRINEAGIPYISVLTDPTTGGVYASYASLGDVIIAEPGAHIGFAGPRLIEGALKVKLPEGFQSAEYQFENGYVDQIVKRADMRNVLGKLLGYLPPDVPLAELPEQEEEVEETADQEQEAETSEES